MGILTSVTARIILFPPVSSDSPQILVRCKVTLSLSQIVIQARENEIYFNFAECPTITAGKELKLFKSVFILKLFYNIQKMCWKITFALHSYFFGNAIKNFCD